MIHRSLAALLATATASVLLLAPAANAGPICIDIGNHQYFVWGATTLPLVGASAEYICHIPIRERDRDYCTFENPGSSVVGHENYINDLAAKGLNLFRLWVGLNHSPGKQDPLGDGDPWDHEQPFPWNGTQWDLRTAPWNATFFNHIRDVIAYASAKGVVVEVTLFDPWSGAWELGPWHASNLLGGTAFATEQEFVTLPAGGACATSFLSGPRKRQVDMIKQLANTINHLDNFYWEIANEPEINAANGVTGVQAAAWHDCMVQQLYNHEGTLPNGRHMIGVNYHTTAALNTIRDNTYPASVPKIKIVNAHYVELSDTSRRGAIDMIRDYHGGPSGSLDRVFGFNESHITPIHSGVTADTVRAEAWEFMVNEGGIYNHLGYQWNTSPMAATVRTQLGVLRTFLKSRNLLSASRSIGNPPPWLPNLPPYDTPDGGSAGARIYWAAMTPYTLYIHHSKMSTGGFRHYLKPTSILRIQFLDVQLPANIPGGSYSVTWVRPDTGAVLSSTTFVSDGSRKTLTVPAYSYDIALRIDSNPRRVTARLCHPNCCAPN